VSLTFLVFPHFCLASSYSFRVTATVRCCSSVSKALSRGRILPDGAKMPKNLKLHTSLTHTHMHAHTSHTVIRHHYTLILWRNSSQNKYLKFGSLQNLHSFKRIYSYFTLVLFRKHTQRHTRKHTQKHTHTERDTHIHTRTDIHIHSQTQHTHIHTHARTRTEVHIHSKRQTHRDTHQTHTYTHRRTQLDAHKHTHKTHRHTETLHSLRYA